MRILSAPSTSKDVLGAAFDFLPHELVVVDHTGAIVMVNDPYVAFGADNGLEGADETLGTNYVAVCRQAARAGNRTAGRIATALLAILVGDRERFETVYDCHSPWELRWFRLTIARWERGGQHGAVLVHENATADIQAERAVLLAQQPPTDGDDTQYAVDIQDRLDALARRIEFVTRHPMSVTEGTNVRVITAPEAFMTAFARLLLTSPRAPERPVEIRVSPGFRSVLVSVDGLERLDRDALQTLARLPGRCDLGTITDDDGEHLDLLLKAARPRRDGP